jgi:glycosyltransferase involved in cell wall biosynthesis
MGYDVEVIVVDGESTDGTREVALDRGAKVIDEPRRGYGRAYKTGLALARGDIIVTGDADGQYPFSLIPALVKLMERGVESRRGEIFASMADVSKVEKVLGFKPRKPLEEGIKELIEAYSGSRV